MIIEVTEGNQHIPESKGRKHVLKTWLTRQGEVRTEKGGAEATQGPKDSFSCGILLFGRETLKTYEVKEIPLYTLLLSQISQFYFISLLANLN